MALSQIQLTFNEDLATNDFVQFYMSNDMYPGLNVALKETWKTIRSAGQQVTIGTPTANVGERSAINFVTAFMLDFGGTGFTITRSVNVVTIVCPETYLHFNTFSTNADVDGVITNVTPSTFIRENLTFSQATTPCTHVLVTVETSELATKITSPISINPNTNNPFSFEWLRGTEFTLTMENAGGDVVNELVETPPLLNASNFTIQVNSSPNGGTATVSATNSNGLDLEYSLDGTTWQTGNTFSGLVPDDYTLHVRDQYGCLFTKDFNVDEFGIYAPFFYIDKANSFRFANRVTFGGLNYKTDENTLSCEADVEEPWMEVQQFKAANVPTNQFKSNYATNTVKIVRDGLADVTVPVTKMTNNIGIKDKRDARKYNLGNGKTGIYFLSGNIYDYVSNAVVGTHALNGNVPTWAVPGNYIEISGAWFLIEQIIFDEDKNAEVVVFTNTYTGAEAAVIVGSIYNLFDYEVYEFTIDMADYIDQYFRVKIEAIDSHFPTITHLSEKIWCKVEHENVLEIRYRNTTNTNVFYATGIEHIINIPYTVVKGKDESDSEIHKTDSDAKLLNADIYESEEFLFEPVTKEIWRKLKIALSTEELFINGVGYVKNGDFNTEGPLGKTNLYVLTATMMKTGNVYNSQTTGLIDFNTGSAEIPGLIQSDSGFVKY